MTIFIMNFNWFEWCKKQAEYLTSCGHEVIIVDNGSTYPPLLEWYKISPYKIISTKGVKLEVQNRFVWVMNLHNIYTKDNYYAVTDSDLALEEIPKNFTEILIEDIERNPEIIKSGFSLEKDDLPDNPYASIYKESEKNNFSNQDEFGFYNIQIDTTFAVYSKERCSNLHKLWRNPNCEFRDSFLDDAYFYRAHRSPRPYIAKHLPWYMDINNLNDEQLHHISVAKYGAIYNFKNIFRNELKQKYKIILHD